MSNGTAIAVRNEGKIKGVWATTPQGTIGLVAEADKPPYVCVYGAQPGPLPLLAVYPSQDNEIVLQVARHGDKTPKLYNLSDLLERIGYCQLTTPVAAVVQGMASAESCPTPTEDSCNSEKPCRLQ